MHTHPRRPNPRLALALLSLLTLVLTAGQCNDANNSPPTADAGDDRTVVAGEPVTLDGNASSDPDNDPLSFAWAFESTPAGSGAALADADTPTPRFTPDVAGEYEVTLTVSDGRLEASDGVSVTALPPGSPRIEEFDASPAVIPSGGSATLSWSVSGDEPLTLVMDGGVGVVSGESSVEVTPASTTTYTLTAVNAIGSASAQTTVVVNDPPSVTSFAPERVEVAGRPLRFAWSVSDPDGDTLRCTLEPGDGASSVVVDDCTVNTDASYVYDHGGRFTATLSVEDDDGEVATAEAEVPILDRLAPSDGDAARAFGRSVAVSGSTLVVGASDGESSGAETGAVYVFAHDGERWAPQGKLVAGDGSAGDLFGLSVAVDGDTALVGAPGDGSRGSAYVFERDGATWTEVDKLFPSEGGARDFGVAVALDRSVAVVGAPGSSGGGSAYLFARSSAGWSEVTPIAAALPSSERRFGAAVAISGDRVVVGAPSFDDESNAFGVAHAFRCVNVIAPTQIPSRPCAGPKWVEEKWFEPDEPSSLDSFGHSVAIDGVTAMVGAPRRDGRGSVFVFERSGTAWTEVDELSSGRPGTFERFGFSIVVEGDVAVVGAPNDDDEGDNAGAVYVFTRTGGVWTESDKLTAADGSAFDLFGHAVAVSRSTVVVGTGANNLGQEVEQGFAYVLGP